MSAKRTHAPHETGVHTHLHSEAYPSDILQARFEAFSSELLRRLRTLNEQLLQEHRSMKPLMSVSDVARTLGVSDRTVEKLIASGKLRPLWIKGQRRFHPDAVDAYVRSCEGRSRSQRRAAP